LLRCPGRSRHAACQRSCERCSGRIETRVAGPRDAHQYISIGLVVEANAASVVDYLDELIDEWVVDARVFRVGDVHGGRMRPDDSFQRFEVGVTVFLRHEGEDLEARSGWRGRVAGMREHRRNGPRRAALLRRDRDSRRESWKRL